MDSAKQVDPAIWDNAFVSDYLDSRYYEILEETLREQFEFHYAVLTNAQTSARAVQPIFFADQTITGGLPAHLQRLPGFGVFSRVAKFKMAVMGCAVGEGKLGSDEPWAVDALAEMLIQYGRKKRAGILLFKDFPATYREKLQRLNRFGFKRISSMPATELRLDFSTFDEYLHLKVGGGFRSNFRRKLRDNEKMGHLDFEASTNALNQFEEIYPLYLQTYERSAFQFEKLTPGYFVQIGMRMPDRARFFMWRDSRRILAFALCLALENTMYYLNVGMDYRIALERHLYFVIWRDLINWALDNGIERIEVGPLNYEAKFRLGMRLVPRDLYARHASPALNPLFSLALKFLEPARHDPALRKFPNAEEL